jgi:thiamine-phosphate pyrophosphorylase
VSPQNNSLLDSALRPGRKPILCYVTDRRNLQNTVPRNSLEPLLEKIEIVASAGVDWIQLREKDLSGRTYASLAGQVLRRISNQADRPPGVRLLVNDRLDVAIAERAHGVHLGENSLPSAGAKRMIAASQMRTGDFLVGVSCHSLEAAKSAASAGANYIFFGPVFATPSKAAYGAPQGLDQLARICSAIEISVLAIGGITLENAALCLSAGASGIAAIRLFQDSSDPASIVRTLHDQIS